MSQPSPTSADQARATFPRGLVQPEGGFRFAVDALLLASFAAPQDGARVLDLGAGCGVIGLAVLLLDGERTRVVGVDRDPAMVLAARENAVRLGLDEHYEIMELDVRSLRHDPRVQAESFDAVLTNPPYRRPGQGRRSPSPARDAARFETAGGLEDFLAAAAYALRNKGTLFCIFSAQRLRDLLEGCVATGLEPKRILPVHGRSGDEARLVLVQARKNGNPGLSLEPGLVLYRNPSHGGGLSNEALAFCPWLACNMRGSSDTDVDPCAGPPGIGSDCPGCAPGACSACPTPTSRPRRPSGDGPATASRPWPSSARP